MRLFDDLRSASALALSLALSACAAGGGSLASLSDNLPANGPQSDYPVVVGNPYVVNGVTYTPEDVLNYDEVGRLALDPQGGSAITGSHHTLPLPSYAEVTSLETGRTILIRLERRGPMAGTQLLAISAGAMAQLGATPDTPVRVRRVNPPEEERALLRAGESAALRMDTPMSLVAVLQRKLDAVRPGPPPSSSAPAQQQTVQVQTAPVLSETPPASAAPASATSFATAFAATEQSPPAEAADAGFVVQAAAFSTMERATNAADALGGAVTRAGALFRVRTGPFATRDQAEASLAKVRAAGYKDARIFTTG